MPDALESSLIRTSPEAQGLASSVVLAFIDEALK